MLARGHIVAGVLCIVATVGWITQGLGNAFYYRQVCESRFLYISNPYMEIRYGHIIQLQVILWIR